MKNVFRLNKKVAALLLLFAATLLLLEIPQQYYKRKDEMLLAESGGAKYEIQAIKRYETFADRAEAFRDYNVVCQIGHTEKLSSGELNEKITEIMEELNKMAGDSCDFTEWVKRGDLESLGMEAQVISRSEREDEQYVWEIGLLNLTLLDTDEGMLIFYDVDTNMIFSCESYGQSELNSDEVYVYYKEAGVNKPSVIFDKEYWMIAAIPEAEIYGNMLVTELNELLWYHWNSYYEYTEKIVGEETEIDSMP